MAAICAMSAELNCITPWYGSEESLAQIVGPGLPEHMAGTIDGDHAGVDQEIVDEPEDPAVHVRDLRP